MDLISNLQTTLDVLYKHDTSVKIEVDSVTNFPADGVVRIDDATEWVLQRYDVVDIPNKELETLTDPKAIFESSGAVGHEFAIGTTVTLVFTGDYLDELVPGTPLLADGTVPLTANWDAAAFQIRALTFRSDIATGNPPLIVASTTVVPNLNADLVDGHHFADAILAAGTVPLTAAWDAGSWQIRAETFRSDVVTGTPPFIVASTTKVPNLNAHYLDGSAAGSWVFVDGSTPLTGSWDAGAFQIRALTFYSDVATGTAPLTVLSTTMVDNLNAELVQGVALTAAELGELGNIGATTISAAQWGYVGALTSEPIEGDGTAGRVLRMTALVIRDGTNANTIKCALNKTLAGTFNGDTLEAEDNLAKAGSTTSFALDASGAVITLKPAGVSGNLVGVIACVGYNATGTSIISRSWISGNDAIINFSNLTTGADVDLTDLADTGAIYVELLYITDA